MKYALSAAAFLRLASMANGQIVKGDDENQVSGEEWATVQESANFTYSQTFTGRDVSVPFPGEEQDGWELRLAIKDNLDDPSTDNSTQLTGSTIALSGPSGDVEFDDSWNLCLHVFPVRTSSGGFGTEFAPDCEGLVAAECVDDLKKRGIDKFENGCPVYSYSPSCLRDLAEDVAADVVSVTADNADRLLGNDTSFYRSWDGTHPADDAEHTSLLAAADLPKIVISVWGPSGESDEKAFAQAVCVQANTVEGDSFDPLAPTDAASGLTAFAGWAALTGAVAYQLLL